MARTLKDEVISAIDIAFYYDFNDDNFSIRNTITDVDVDTKHKDGEDGTLVVIITTRRPGIIIGKGGKDIDKLRDILIKGFADYFDYVEIKLIENKLQWYAGCDQY